MKIQALTVFCLLASCRSDEAPADVSPTGKTQLALEPGDVLYTDRATRLRFPIPEAGVGVEAEHFDDPTLEVYQWRHELRINGSDGTAVMVHVWNNPERVPLARWFFQNQQFLLDSDMGVQRWEQKLGRAQKPGLMVSIPPSEQAPSQALAVLAHGEQIIRVTCIGFDEAAEPRELFYKVLDNLELGVTP